MVRLYIQLKSVDTLKGYILPKGKQAETSELLDLFDVNEVQKKLIENYQDNASIEMTLDNRGTLEMQVKQLQKDLKGTSWLPRIKKKLHNDRVSKLGKIIKTDNLKRRGFFSPDNFFTGFVYGTLGMFTMFNGMGYLIGGEDLIVSSYENFFSEISPLAIIHTIISPFAGIGTGYVSQKKRSGSDRSLKEARYVDKRIKELL